MEMKTITLITLALLLFGCNVQKREIAKMEVYAVRYPGPFKALANTLDPCFSGVAKSDTVITWGKADTTVSYAFSDSTTGTLGHPQWTYVSKPQIFYPIGDIKTTSPITTVSGVQRTIIKTINIKTPVYRTIHDTLTDQRALAACQAVGKSATDSLLIVKTQLTLKTKEASKFKLWFWLLAGSIIAGFTIYWGIKVYLLFTTGGVVKAGSGLLSLFKK